MIRPGKILFEMEGVPLDVATEAMRLAASKLPLPTKLVTRETEGVVHDGSTNFSEHGHDRTAEPLQESQEQLFRLRFQIGMGQTEGVKKYRELRKDRARMLGVLRERELDQAKARQRKEAESAKKRGKKGK